MIETIINSQHPIVTSTISLILTGLVLFGLKTLPLSLYEFLKEQMTTTINVTNYHLSYYKLIKYFQANNVTKYSRILVLLNGRHGFNDTTMVGPGQNGTHYIYMLNKFFKITVVRNNSSVNDRDKEELFLTYLGRNHKYIKELINEIDKFSEEDKNPETTDIWKYNDGVWYKKPAEYKRSIDSVFLDYSIKETVMTHIDHFIKYKPLYKEIGKPYRTTIMLHGVPGTGKTSLIKALAAHYDKDLALLGSNTNDLDVALAEAPENSFLVLEDVDGLSGTTVRKGNKQKEDVLDKMEASNVSKLLNTLDGIGSFTGRVLFMTTNHLDKLDPALLRKGRCDLIVEVVKPSKEILSTITDDPKELNKIMKMKGSDLQDYLLKRKIKSQLD